MAVLQFSNGRLCTDSGTIGQILNALDVELKHYQLKPLPLVTYLLEREVLDAADKQQLLEFYKQQFACLGRQRGYTWCDLLLMHPGSPNLQTLMTQFSRYHIHTAPEAIYGLTGQAIFGFVQPDGEHLQLLIQPGDFLQIAAQVEHWFSPAASLEFKAVRYFTTTDGWTPFYTTIEASDSSNPSL